MVLKRPKQKLGEAYAAAAVTWRRPIGKSAGAGAAANTTVKGS